MVQTTTPQCLCSLQQATLTLLTFAVMTFTVTHCYDRCQTLTTNILVTKEKTYEYNGRHVRLMCVGQVPANKCEGTCVSQVSPSIVHYPGFKKDCKCCREKETEQRTVTLEECYDGNTLVQGQVTSITINEPTECLCQPCTS